MGSADPIQASSVRPSRLFFPPQMSFFILMRQLSPWLAMRVPLI